jgi:hypothetical protein
MDKPSKIFYNFWKTTEKMSNNFFILGTRIVSL